MRKALCTTPRIGHYSHCVTAEQSATVGRSHLALDIPIRAKCDDVFGARAQYHVSDPVKIDDLRGSVIGRYSLHFTDRLPFQSPGLDALLSIVLGASEHKFFDVNVRT